ncbi:hypothetical protein AAG570_006029 [Ranatra chinensis]|uniref:Uncharacterized protein n=1 Tax=Ranatra chinensis TaxID=642074 RepID=A0ABD0YIK6_9HEMI
MASKRRYMFRKNKTQGTTEIGTCKQVGSIFRECLHPAFVCRDASRLNDSGSAESHLVGTYGVMGGGGGVGGGAVSAVVSSAPSASATDGYLSAAAMVAAAATATATATASVVALHDRHDLQQAQYNQDIQSQKGGKLHLPLSVLFFWNMYCDNPQSLGRKMASKRRNMFQKDKTQETTENALHDVILAFRQYSSAIDDTSYTSPRIEFPIPLHEEEATTYVLASPTRVQITIAGEECLMGPV